MSSPRLTNSKTNTQTTKCSILVVNPPQNSLLHTQPSCTIAASTKVRLITKILGKARLLMIVPILFYKEKNSTLTKNCLPLGPTSWLNKKSPWESPRESLKTLLIYFAESCVTTLTQLKTTAYKYSPKNKMKSSKYQRDKNCLVLSATRH